MSVLTVIAAALAGVALLVCSALAVLVLRQRRELQALQLQLGELLQNLLAQQRQQHEEMLAMGQRVMEADKLVRRFHDRVDALEQSGPTRTQYGQLESLLTKSIGETREASAAETELLALLRQQQRRS